MIFSPNGLDSLTLRFEYKIVAKMMRGSASAKGETIVFSANQRPFSGHPEGAITFFREVLFQRAGVHY